MADERTCLVVLSHNGLDTSKKFYDCLVKHTDPAAIVLVWIDNGSTDGTVDWLKSTIVEFDYNISLYPENKGVINGRNVGFDIFRYGEENDSLRNDPFAIDKDVLACNYLLFLDNDQYVKEGWLEQHMAVLKSGYDIVGVEAWQMNRTYLPVSRCRSLSDWYCYVGCGGMLMTRQAVEVLGSFDSQFNPSYYEDPDYCFRAAQQKLKVGWNIAARIVHQPHQTLGVASDRHQRFTNSLKKFRLKWKDHEVPRFMQKKLPAFDA